MNDSLSAKVRATRPSLGDLRGSEAGALASLGITLFVSSQWLGGVPLGSQLVTALGAIVSLALALRATTRTQETRAFEPLLLVMTIALAWTVVQATPLPCSWVAALDPEGAAHTAAGRQLLGIEAYGCTLSRAPGATRWEVVKGVSVVGLFAAAWLLARRGLRRWLLATVAFSILAMALVGLAHRAAGAVEVFGLYLPVYSMDRPVLAPITNPNNLAGFLVMGVPLFAGLAFAETSRAKRIVFLTGAAVIGATIALTLSRGGIAALVGGLLTLAVLEGMSRAHRGGRSRIVWLAGLVASIAGLGALVSAESILRELGDHDLSKFEVIAEALRLAQDHPLLGIGRGAFASVFPSIDSAEARYRALHAENAFAHWAVEWGVPLALALVVGVLFSLWRAAKARTSPERRGAIAGVVALGLSNVVDFGLELAGVAAVGTVLLASAVAERPSRRASRPRTIVERFPFLRSDLLGKALVLVSIPLLIVMAASGGASAFDLESRLRESLHARDRESFRKTLVEAVSLHPSEPSFALLAGGEALLHRDASSGRWLSRAMNLAPAWSEPHRLAAEGLFRRGAFDQALLEIREAARRMPGSGAALLCRMLRVRPDPTMIERAAPPAPKAMVFLESVARCAPPGPVQAAVDDAILGHPEASMATRIRRATRLFAEGQADRALGELRALASRPGLSPSDRVHVASALLRAAAPEDALRVLARAPRPSSEDRGYWEVKARAHAALGEAEAMRSTIDTLKADASDSPERLAATFELLGRLEESLGHRAIALREYDRAARLAPSADRLLRVGRVAERLGDEVRAYRTFADLCARHPEVAEACEKKDALRKGRSPSSDGRDLSNGY